MLEGQASINDLVRTVKLQFPQQPETGTPSDSNKGKFLHVHIQPIDAITDVDIARDWTEYYLPRWPELVKGANDIGNSYSAVLVRQKGSLGKFAPVIRFQSSRGQTDEERKIILGNIRTLCDEKGCRELPVHFSTGTVVRLVGGPHQEDETQSYESEPPRNSKFPHQRRYWQTPGMGASIGMTDCPHVSATLGGYIMIGTRRYMLSVNHFIQRARTCNYCERRDLRSSLSSPSLCDVKEMEMEISKKMKLLEQALKPNVPVELPAKKAIELIQGCQGKELMHYQRFYDEHRRPMNVYGLGTLQRHNTPIGDEENSDTQTGMPLTMDWAIFEVDRPRRGENKYRHPQPTEPGVTEFEKENANVQGLGESCQASRLFKSGENVHYVGNRSGFSCGDINLVQSFFKEQGREYYEWGIVPSGLHERESNFQGDSGAWILGHDNQLLGLLWGYNNGLLLFTPIKEVFEDIAQTTHCEVKVAPPNGHRPGAPGQVVHICRVGNIPNSIDRLSNKDAFRTAETKVETKPLVPVHFESWESPESMASDLMEIRSPSPDPSLTSSTTSLSETSSEPPSPSLLPQPLADLADLTGKLSIKYKQRLVASVLFSNEEALSDSSMTIMEEFMYRDENTLFNAEPLKNPILVSA